MKQGWEIKKLGEVIKEYSVRNKYGAEYPVYSVTNSLGFCRDYFSKEVASKEKRTYKIVPKGCFAYNPSRINVGSVDWQRNEDNVIVSPLYVVFETFKEINNDYLLYYLKSETTMLYINNLATGTVRANLKFDILSSFPICVPPLPVQEQIVSELDLLSGIIEKKREQLKELDALAQSIFYDMFGDPITNEKGWEVKKLGEVCDDITDGDHMPPPKSEIGIPFLTISNIDKEKRELNFNDTFFVTEEYYDNIKENRKAKRGDVLYTVTGSYGIPVIVNTDKHFCFQRHIALLKPTQETLLPIFLCHWFLCDGVKFIADQVATGIAQKTVSLTSIRKFEIILPPLPLQHQFASKIEAIERQKELIKQSISETETLFNERMQHYFS